MLWCLLNYSFSLIHKDTLVMPLAIGIGAWACFTITARCLMAGILQMLLGVVVALIEVPCFCAFLDFAQNPYNYFEKRPYWHKALLYVILSAFIMVLCGELSTFVGSGLVFVTGSLYGIMALGKKASKDEMMMKAASMSSLIPTKEQPQDVDAGPSSAERFH
ncbi:calcium channel flower-like isoform X4 [Limulus polyphemus]|uniref:Calcium channel flower n=1 Tax=Limulus polyphemus TaxID=6850 RepID=A0ABM1SGH7_LIMPO|nr:calcium channel flower-like isoform X4 [Limulus polyphemus]